MKNLLIAFGAGAVIATAIAVIVSNRTASTPPAAPSSDIVVAQVTEPAKEEIQPAEEKNEAKTPSPVVAESAPKMPITIERPAPQPRPKRESRPKENTVAKRDENAIVIPPPAPMQLPPSIPATTTNEAPKEVAKIDPPKQAEEKPHVEILRPAPAAPVQREPEKVTVNAGTQLSVRLAESLSTETIKTGDTFQATLADPLIVNGFVIADKGARVTGRVVESTRAGRVKGTASLTLELVDFASTDGQRVAIQTESFTREGATSRGSDAVKVGAGAAIGAALGAIFGGGKGAAIGAASGAGAGAGTVAMTRGKPAVLDVETRIPFQLKSAVTITEKIR